MGNKQTIFTDEQLDAYQVRYLGLHSGMKGNNLRMFMIWVFVWFGEWFFPNIIGDFLSNLHVYILLFLPAAVVIF